jgi:hypothetical protein
MPYSQRLIIVTSLGTRIPEDMLDREIIEGDPLAHQWALKNPAFGFIIPHVSIAVQSL